jgi:DNA-binding FrmR family transcriptional regulator
MLTPQAQKEMLTRMRRIEGQARGVHRMIAEDRDCLEILTQLASLRSAAYSVSVALTRHYAAGCVYRGEQEESATDTMQDLVDVLLRAPH